MEEDGPMNFSTQENTKAVNSTLKLRMIEGEEGNLGGGQKC